SLQTRRPLTSRLFPYTTLFRSETSSNPFLVEVGEHVESIAAELGYQVLYFNTSNDGDKTDRLLQVCIEKEIDGVMIAPAEGLERSEEHTSELQSREDLVCRLLL